ncbi:MAG: hypothetical protein ACFB0B_23100 [Thermonemataceae bacterium]
MKKELNVYVAFSEDDNTYSEEQKGNWVEAFKKYLVPAIEHEEQLEINYVDEARAREILTTENETYLAIFNVLSTQALTDKAYTDLLQELNKNIHSGRAYAKHRAYKIVREEYSVEEPVHMHALPAFQFHFQDVSSLLSEALREMFNEEDINPFLFKMLELANQVNDDYREETTTIQKEKVGIYLAEVNSDLQLVRDSIRRELTSLGYEVYPKEGTYDDPEEFLKVLKEGLANSRLSIHLFGDQLDKDIPEFNMSLSLLQNDLAVKHFRQTTRIAPNSFQRIIWFMPTEEIEEHKQRVLLDTLVKEKTYNEGADIVKCPLEELKEVILEKLKQKHNSKFFNDLLPSRSIYLIYDEYSEEDTKATKEILESHNLPVVVLDKETAPKDFHQKNYEYLFTASSIVLVNTNGDLKWLRSKLKDALRVKIWAEEKTYNNIIFITRQLTTLPDENIFEEIKLLNDPTLIQHHVEALY